MIKSKLLRNITSKLKEQKDENNEWTIETFRMRLKRHLTNHYDCITREMKTCSGQMLIALVCRIRL